jgi:putative spermidine/putrescine transport system permease protein
MMPSLTMAGLWHWARERVPVWGLATYAIGVCGFLLAPIIIATILSFSSVSQIIFPPPGLSLHWYDVAWSTEQYLTGFRLSIVIALGASLISTICGTGVAIALNHYRLLGRSIVQVLVILPIILPGVVIGLDLLFALPIYRLRTGMIATMLGHSLLGTSYVTFLVLAALANYDMSLERASLNLGATRWQTFWKITFPLIRSGIAAGAVFAFLISFDNVPLSIFLARGDTLPLRLMQTIQFHPDPSVAAVSTVLAIFSVLVLFLFGKALRAKDIGSLKS